MIPILTVSEYETIKIGDTFSQEQKIITRLQANHIEKWEKENKKSIFKWGNKKIIPQQWVGILSIPNLQIEILPKIEMGDIQKTRANLLYMLSIAKDVPFRENEVSNVQSSKNTFLESYITLFIKRLNWAIKKGIIHQYRQIENNENFLRGKLMLSKHIQKNLSNKTKFYIRYDEFSINNIINRILKATIIKLINLTQSHNNLKNLRLLEGYFSDVDEKEFRMIDFSNLDLTRTNENYHRLLEMCKIFWKEHTTNFHSADIQTFSLLFDMNKIYERFIQNILSKYQDEIFENTLSINKEIKSKYLLKTHLNRGVFNLIPDNIIMKKGSNKISRIIDTKWKILDNNKANFGISQVDIYQMYAYAREFDCEEVILLYPKTLTDNEHLPAYFNDRFMDHNIKITIQTVNLNVNLPDEIHLIIKEIKSYFK